jgi:hypothetical protein
MLTGLSSIAKRTAANLAQMYLRTPRTFPVERTHSTSAVVVDFTGDTQKIPHNTRKAISAKKNNVPLKLQRNSYTRTTSERIWNYFTLRLAAGNRLCY